MNVKRMCLFVLLGSMASVGQLLAQDFVVQGIDWNNSNARVAQFFTVGEVFASPAGVDWNRRNALFSLPEAERDRIISNILSMAARLDEVRLQYGRIAITSWFRDAETNRRVSGAPNSWHLQGLAVDMRPLDRNGQEVQDSLEGYWSGGLGRGWERHGFIHLDLGPRRAWDY